MRKKMNVGDSLLLIFTGVVAASTVFYAVLTRQLVIEIRRLREVQTEPRVSVRVETDHPGRHGYELTISNEGQEVAKNVRFAFEGDSSYFRNSWAGRTPPELNELSVIKDGLEYLEPNQVYRFFLGTVSSKEFERAVKAPWRFCTEYENLRGKRRTETYTVDFSQFKGMFFDANPLKDIAGYIQDIQKDLKDLTKGLSSDH